MVNAIGHYAEKSTLAPPGKNPSDAYVYTRGRSRGVIGAIGAIAPPKTYKSNIFHNEFFLFIHLFMTRREVHSINTHTLQNAGQ